SWRERSWSDRCVAPVCVMTCCSVAPSVRCTSVRSSPIATALDVRSSAMLAASRSYAGTAVESGAAARRDITTTSTTTDTTNAPAASTTLGSIYALLARIVARFWPAVKHPFYRRSRALIPILVALRLRSRMPIGLRTMLIYSAGSIGAGAFFASTNIMLPLSLKTAGAPDLLTGLLSSTLSIEGVVIQPTVGAASDRIWTRLGRRRPFIAICIPLSAVFFLVASAATESLVPLAVSIFLFSIFFNAAIHPYAALLADITPINQRGLLSGLSQGIQLIGQVGFLGLIVVATKGEAAPPWAYWGVAVAMVATFAVTVGGIHEPLVVAAFGGTFIRDLPETIVVVVLAGVGNGAQTAVSWPLLTTLIDPDESGIFAGLKAAAESVAIPLSVFVAAEVFLNPRALNLGYRGIFFMLAINMVLALILLIAFVHPPRDAAP